jgi:hypothetical protein
MSPECEIFLMGTGINEIYQSHERKHLSHSRNVIYDCTAGLPKGRESYGNGGLIIVVGVTTHRGGCDIKQPQGEGDQEIREKIMKGMRNAES